MEREYIYLKGFREGSILLYVLADKRLYIKKTVRPNKQVEWICYQTILTKTDDTQPKCTARVIIHSDGKMTLNKICHSEHNDHSVICKDMEAINEMKNKCDYVRTELESIAHKISAEDIFLQVMKKYDVYHEFNFSYSIE